MFACVCECVCEYVSVCECECVCVRDVEFYLCEGEINVEDTR